MRLLELDRKKLAQYFVSIGEKGFRAGQVVSWIWDKGVLNPRAMTNLSETVRAKMQEDFTESPVVLERVASPDRSKKFLIQMTDGAKIESVLMKSAGHDTLCVSTQAGCPFQCTFCQSGRLGMERNLDASEILYQVAFARPKPRNIVFMGIGEPLANWNNFKTAVLRLNDEARISMRHMAVSTVGVPGMIVKLGNELPNVRLAISLHAPTQRLREKIMPKAAKTMSIKSLMEEVRMYQAITKNRVTFEYIMLKGINDSTMQAEELSDLLFGAHGLVNLIPYNSTDDCDFEPSPPSSIRHFLNKLRDLGLDATVRKSLGFGTDSACGQLRYRRSDDD